SLSRSAGRSRRLIEPPEEPAYHSAPPRPGAPAESHAMNLEPFLGKPGSPPILAGLVGVGEIGRSFLSQARLVPGLSARVACDRDVERAAAAFRSVGLDPEEVRICDSAAAAQQALEAGKVVVVAEAELLLELPVDIVVEATGQPE